MEDLQIQPTKKTPLIDFYTSGKLILAGSVYPENSKEFFEPVIDWIRELEAPRPNPELASAESKIAELQQHDADKEIRLRLVETARTRFETIAWLAFGGGAVSLINIVRTVWR